MVENEAYFRQANRQVVQGLKDLLKLAKREKYRHPLPDENHPIGFYCECSDENCRLRLKLTPALYQKLHKNSSQFILSPGHHVPKIEKITKSKKDFILVEKYMTPPEKVDTLHATNVENV